MTADSAALQANLLLFVAGLGAVDLTDEHTVLDSHAQVPDGPQRAAGELSGALRLSHLHDVVLDIATVQS